MIFFLLTASRSNFYIAFALQSYKNYAKTGLYPYFCCKFIKLYVKWEFTELSYCIRIPQFDATSEALSRQMYWNNEDYPVGYW